MLVDFKMTPNDVKVGVRGDCEECPAARAILRKMRKLAREGKLAAPVLYVSVAGSTIISLKGWTESFYSRRAAVDTPEDLIRWIKQFDSSYEQNIEIPEPFAFQLDLPDHLFS